MECWLIPETTNSRVNGQMVPTWAENWVVSRAFPEMSMLGIMDSGLMEALPNRETVTGAFNSTWTGKPMSDGNMIWIGDKSMVFWKLTFISVWPGRMELGFCNRFFCQNFFVKLAVNIATTI